LVSAGFGLKILKPKTKTIEHGLVWFGFGLNHGFGAEN
jgi:hypothetical protein